MATSSAAPSNNVFKDSVQSIIVKVFSTIKSGASTIAGPQFEEFATQIASRSPVLGQKTKVIPKIESNSVNALPQKNFVESPLSDDFKESLKKDSTFSSSDAKSNDINQHISDILDTLDKLVAKEGVAGAKKAEIYKKYESYYETYKKFLEDSGTKNKDISLGQNKLKSSIQPSIIGSGIPSAEANNSTLPDINITGQNVNVTSTSDKNKENTPASIVEVLNKTTPTFLSKVFDEKLVSKFAQNIREKLSKFTTNNNTVKDRIASTTNSDSIFSTNNSTSSDKIVSVSDKVESLNTTSDTTNNIISSSADKVSTTKESIVEREIKEDTWREEDSHYKEDIIFELRRINDFLSKRKDSTSDKESDDRDSEDITKKKRSPLLDKVLDKVKDKLSKTSAVKRVKDLLDTVKDKLDIKKKQLPGLEIVPDSIPDFDLQDFHDKDTSRKTPRKTTSGKLSKFSKIPDFFKDKISATGSEKLILPESSENGLDLPDIPDFNRNKPIIRPKGKLSGGRVPGMLQRSISRIASGASRLGSGAVNLAARAVPMLSSAASAAAPYALPALAVASAAAAGYGAGTVLNSGISAGLSKVTGQDTTLGGWIYDKFNPEEPAATTAVPQKPNIPSSQPASANTSAIPPKTAVTPSAVVKIPSLPDTSFSEKTSNVESVKTVSDITKVVASQTQLVSKISAATDVKDKIETAKASAPPVVNNITNVSNSSSGGGSSGGSPIIAPSHIRNIESSFERVQMQDFWPRTK